MKYLLLLIVCLALPRTAGAQLVFPPDGGDILAYYVDGGVAYTTGFDGGHLPVFDLDPTGQLVCADSLTVLGKGTQGYPEINGDGLNLYTEASTVGNTYAQVGTDAFSVMAGTEGSGDLTVAVLSDLYSTLATYIDIGITPSGDGGNGLSVYTETPGFPEIINLRDNGQISASSCVCGH